MFSRPTRMSFVPAIGKLFLLVLMVALPALSAPLASAAETPKKVLIFSGVDPNIPSVIMVSEIFRSTLEKGSSARVQFYSEALDNLRIPDDKYEQELVKLLQRKYQGEKFDLIFTITSPALKFLLKHQDELFPDTPTIFFNTSERDHEDFEPRTNVTGVQGGIELKSALDLALSLHPGTRRVVVVPGIGLRGRFWESLARKQFQSYGTNLEFTYPPNLTIEALRKDLGSLPQGTVVLFISVLADSAGNAYSLPESVSLVAPYSSAPIYVVYQDAFRPGVVGGRMISYEALAKAAAELGLRVLGGEKPQDIPPQNVSSVAMFDWRELRRWGIDEATLPPGSIVRYKDSSVWELYKWRISGAIALIVLQALGIVWLLFTQARRRQAEEAKNNLAAIVETSDDAILSKTLEGIIISWNAGAEKIYGYSASEIVGQHVSILAPPELKGEVQAILERLSRGVSVDHLETVRLSKEGMRIDVSLTISPIKNERGMIIGASTIARDITNRKKAEVEELQHRKELAHLSRVTMLGELSGSLAHELNQPLTAILSNAQAAQRFLEHDSVDLDELRDILTDIVDQDIRAGEVIHRLRLLLKKGEVQQQPVDVNNTVQEVLKLIDGDLVNQGVTMHTKLAPALPTVKGDRVQLQQVLLNLVMNASDAMNSHSSIDRQMVVCTELSDGEDVRFSVSDCGSGIAPDELEQVFEPFFTTKPHGLGLGLSVCRTIISAHGGKLWAANNPERGATFHFTVPVSNEVNG